jgi:hypothetical protein
MLYWAVVYLKSLLLQKTFLDVSPFLVTLLTSRRGRTEEECATLGFF